MGGPLPSLTSDTLGTRAVSDQGAGEKTKWWNLFLGRWRGAILDILNSVSYLKETWSMNRISG